ncbi:uncharacterized protein LOC131614729 [Vicia villosa]|uniref:uncharacterized protein LOC131614729 n=1 Tax=Vicia villosa TaxID=3911 RepID=UPI00273ABD95|nr:uncharacterized protein LOC131614729 [Vicia villosa]
MVTGETSKEREGPDSQVIVENMDLWGDLKIEEHKFGDYECPEIILSKVEERRISIPWKKGVIVKMLGRRIGYKALENRLNQLWARNGCLSIVDLGQEYYLVTFTNKEDQYSALIDGAWLIYDHYLSMREWKPNFCPASDAIEQVAVWVHVSGMPIEYYDARVLTFIGNRIGVTVKVYRKTLSKERGEYAQLCVQVDISKMLLAMFAIKGRHYKIKYEGLHLLCLRCSRFGHFKEGCEVQSKSNGKGIATVVRNTLEKGETSIHLQEREQDEDGPWKVVQKTRRSRKGKETEKNGWQSGPTSLRAKTPMTLNSIKANINAKGSRFISLNEETMDLEVPNLNDKNSKKNNEENSMGDTGKGIQSPTIIHQRKSKKERKKLEETNKKKVKSFQNVIEKVTRGIEKDKRPVGPFGKKERII